MTDDPGKARWQRLSALFDRALELEPASRDAFLDAECADDPELRGQLARMLVTADNDSALDAGALQVAAPMLSGEFDADGSDGAGQAIGPWRLQRLLGRGGMGEVYLALREGDSGQRAALKRLRQRWDGSQQTQRFEQERRILASLSHANIPALIDHGSDGEDRPWFALEYVDGKTLTDWADAQRLDLRARIDLFRQACAAVQHAHEHFVVHRDLKPANILVDGEGRVRVLDFGVAKLIDDSTAGNTRTGLFAGFTPEYAAPEQVSGGTITAATDVYALGVVLYQLLCGRLPYALDSHDLRGMAEAISHQAPTRPEQAITTGSDDEVRQRLSARGTDLRGFRRFMRGDLGRILQTAMAKEPARRYASVLRLSDDLQRFLQGRTVSVTGDTVAYRARKFVGRNRWGVAMGALAVVALTVGIGGVLHQTQQARAAAERAEREATRAQQRVEEVTAINSFLSQMFLAGSSRDARDGHGATTLEGALDYALDVARKEYADKQPSLVINILNSAAVSYQALGDDEKAEAIIREGLQLQETRLPDGIGERSILLGQLSSLRANYEPEQALRWAEEAVTLARRVDPLDHHNLAVALSMLMIAQYTNDRLPDALDSAREATRILREDKGIASDDLNHIHMLSSEAMLLGLLGRNDEAIPVHERAVDVSARAFGADAPVTADRRLDFAFTLNEAGQHSRAQSQFERALPVLRAANAEGTLDPNSLQWAHVQSGTALTALGRADEALPLLAEAHAWGRSNGFENRQDTVGGRYARALALAGQCTQARDVIDELTRRGIDNHIQRHRPLDGTACAER